MADTIEPILTLHSTPCTIALNVVTASDHTNPSLYQQEPDEKTIKIDYIVAMKNGCGRVYV
jgi:hypothetical protein